GASPAMGPNVAPAVIVVTFVAPFISFDDAVRVSVACSRSEQTGNGWPAKVFASGPPNLNDPFVTGATVPGGPPVQLVMVPFTVTGVVGVRVRVDVVDFRPGRPPIAPLI